MTESKNVIKYILITAAVVLLILSTCMLVNFCGRMVSVVGEEWSYEPESFTDIKSLEIELGAGEIKFLKGEKFLVVSNITDIDISGGVRTVIKEKKRLASDYKGAFFTVYIPEGLSLIELEITTGAGVFYADKLSAEVIDFDFGAGEAVIDELTADKSADIDAGAGDVTIGGGRLHNLQLSMGVGELCLSAEISGEGEVDLGVGEANITLLGGESAYTVEMNKGVGSITLNGENVSGNRTVGTGDNHIEINGGVGEINVTIN